jgi:cytoskeletal protein RodZ
MTSFGTYLREAREQRRIGLDQIAGATRISPHLLHALEADAVEAMPPLPITKGFLRSYASCVGLPAEETVLRYIVFREAASRVPCSDDGAPSGLSARMRRTCARLRAFLTGHEGYQVF